MKVIRFFLICFGLLVAAVSVHAATVNPPKDAVAFRGNHYKAFLDTNSTWWEAKFACEDIGGALVVITTPQENEFVRRLSKGKLIWLGGTDEFEEGKYKAVPEFSQLLECIRSGKNALLLGKAGTGKTLLLQKLVNAMLELHFGNIQIAVSATSGFSASHRRSAGT